MIKKFTADFVTWLGVSLILTAVVLATIAHFSALRRIDETVSAHHHIMAGKAHYLPGKVCVIEAGPDTTTAEVVNYARACAKAHEEFLGEIPDNNQ